MNRSFITAALACLCLLSACRKEFAKGTPECIKQEIRSHSGDNNWIVGKVDEYLFQNKTVYAFEPASNIMDGGTEIRDENCTVICSFGGLGGPSLNPCNGENFRQKAVFQRNIWKKN